MNSTTTEPPAVAQYLAIADRLLPGGITGFYLVGSIALGAYRPSRSDIDFVAVIDRDLTAVELRRLRLAQVLAGARSGLQGLRAGGLALPGTCNGVFVRRADLTTPVSAIEPIASQTGHELQVGAAFDVNPVVWKVFDERAVTIRGAPAPELGLATEPETLEAWNRANLGSYWRHEAERLTQRVTLHERARPRWTTSWFVLGPPRLHCTIATGQVISKEAAGEYALATFDARWHPIIREGLAYLRGEPADPRYQKLAVRLADTAAFASEVVRRA